MSTILRRVTGACLGAICALALATAPALAQEPRQPTDEERAGALARPAVVYLQISYSGYVFDETGTLFNDAFPYEFTQTCTGFVVNPDGYIATAGHCVDVGPEGARGTLIDLAVAELLAVDPTIPVAEMTTFALLNYRTEGADQGSPIDRTVEVITGAGTGSRLAGELLTAQVIDLQSFSEGDVALLKVPATDLPSIELAPDADVTQGTPVLSIGYPGEREAVIDATLEPTFKDGQISSRTTTGSVPVYEVSATVSPGMSGGPTVGLDGRVIGINSFGVGETTAFNFLATASSLNELLGRNNVDPGLGPVDRTYREGLERYFAGEYTEAIERFDEVLDRSPNFRQAQEYKTEAVRDREEIGDPGLDPLWYVVGGGIVLLLAAAAVAAVVISRRRRGGPPPAPGGDQFAPGPGYPGVGPYPPSMPGQFSPAGDFSAPMTGTPEQFSSTPTITRACARCGTSHAFGARFCSNCGNTLG